MVVDDQERRSVRPRPVAAEQRLEVGLRAGQDAADQRLLAAWPADAPAPQLAADRQAVRAAGTRSPKMDTVDAHRPPYEARPARGPRAVL